MRASTEYIPSYLKPTIMAISESILFKKIRGRIGNLVFYTVKDQVRIRSLPMEQKDPKTPKQLAHRAKIKGVAALYNELNMQLFEYWKQLTLDTVYSAYNLFVSANIGNLDGEGRIIDMGRFQICNGRLLLPEAINSRITPQRTIAITWENSPDNSYRSMSNLLRIAVYAPENDEDPCIYILEETQVERSAQTYEYPIPDEIRQNAHFFLFFKDHLNNEVTPSHYLGSI